MDHLPHDRAALTSPAPGVVPLVLDYLAASAWPQPVTTGVPFPRGALAEPGPLSLRAPDGSLHPVQVRVLARWADDSVRWLLVDAVLPHGDVGGHGWALVPGPVSPRETHEYTIDGTGFPTLANVQAATELTLADGVTVCSVRMSPGVVEESGPVRVTLRSEGAAVGKVPLRFVGRVCHFTGTGLVRVRLTVHNPQRARHRGGLWDLGDPGSVRFKDLSIRFTWPGVTSLRWTAAPGEAIQTAPPGPWSLYQDSSGGPNWNGPNHVNAAGRNPCSFRGYRLQSKGRDAEGLRANPVVSLIRPGGAVTVAVPEFWQQFPKALDLDGDQLRVRLFPGQFGDLFELQGGEQKTHTFWLHVGPEDHSEELPLAWVHAPARLRPSPAWCAASGTLPFLEPLAPDQAGDYDAVVRGILDGPESFAAKRDGSDEYGWRHYGDVYADHENAYYQGTGPVVSHYNNQYDVLHGLLFHYLRDGDRRWYDLLDPLARHVLDIDLYHTTRDRPRYNGGLFWHTDHYKTAHACTHRGYSRANQVPGRPYGGGPGNEHNYTTGLLHYYYLTGDPLAREAVVSLADWVVHMDDGRIHLFGFLDPGPTGHASCTYEPGYNGPGRGAGNSVNALLDGWLLTGSAAYLGKAEALIRRVIHPADDVAARDLLNVEARWSYTVFLSVLWRYLLLKEQAGPAARAYAYARASLLHYASWMAENERPYFDRPEQLEYPTETWALQELRKANVLRLAARYAAGALRDRLCRRGEEIAQRAWADFRKFPTRHVTRAATLAMHEGVRDDWLRRHPPREPAPECPEFDFGLPEVFVPQKERVKALLRSPRGWWRALTGLVTRRGRG